MTAPKFYIYNEYNKMELKKELILITGWFIIENNRSFANSKGQKQPTRGALKKRWKYAANLQENTHAEVWL